MVAKMVVGHDRVTFVFLDTEYRHFCDLQPSVDAKLRESYRRVLRHLHENTLSASDLSRIQNALTFLSPLCRDTREAHKDMMGVTLKTDALLRASR